jgi:hypothetical protein
LCSLHGCHLIRLLFASFDILLPEPDIDPLEVRHVFADHTLNALHLALLELSTAKGVDALLEREIRHLREHARSLLDIQIGHNLLNGSLISIAQTVNADWTGTERATGERAMSTR